MSPRLASGLLLLSWFLFARLLLDLASAPIFVSMLAAFYLGAFFLASWAWSAVDRASRRTQAAVAVSFVESVFIPMLIWLFMSLPWFAGIAPFGLSYVWLACVSGVLFVIAVVPLVAGAEMSFEEASLNYDNKK